MPIPNSPPLSTTPLAHVILAPGGASLEIDGRSVRLAGEDAAPSLSAFHAFHDSALADYRNRPPPEKPPGLLSRLRSWLGALLHPKDPSEKVERTVPRTLEPPPKLTSSTPSTGSGSSTGADAPRQASRGRAAPSPSTPSTGSGSSTSSGSSTGADAPRQASQGEPLHLPNDKPIRQPTQTPAPAGASPDSHSHWGRSAPLPFLLSAFADKDGVHLLWQAPSQRQANEVSFTCRLDSDVAHKLQECYSQLGKLGYKVVGLDALSKEAEASPHPEAPRAGASAPQPAPAPQPATAPQAAGAPQAATAKEPPSPPKKHNMAASLEPEPALATVAGTAAMPAKALATAGAVSSKDRSPSGDHSAKEGRGAEKQDKTLLLEISHEAPPEERLTYLRGTLTRSGLKIAEVGLGEGKEGAPGRWEDAARWFARHAEPEPPKPDRSPLPDLL